MRGKAKWLMALAGLALILAAACNGGGGDGGADTGHTYSFADLAGTWNYFYVNKGGFGGTIVWDTNGKIVKWLDPDCGSGKMASAMTFTITSEGQVTGVGKAYCSNSNPATADIFTMSLAFRSATFMKGAMGDTTDTVTVAFYKQ